MTRQLAFDLPSAPRLTRADFTASPANHAALAAIEGWRDWPQARLLLTGPAGAGKTHLAHVWANLADAVLLPAPALDHADIPRLAAAPLALEDAQTLPATAQTPLFHLLNLMAERAIPLLITATTAPRDWGLTLPDLASRLQAMPLARIDAPDDALLSAVLAKLFADRQIAIGPALIPYLLARMDRSLAAATHLVEALDAQALAQGRPVTRSLAATLLDNAQGGVE